MIGRDSQARAHAVMRGCGGHSNGRATDRGRAASHLELQPGQPHGSRTGPRQSVGLTIGGQVEPAAFTHGGRSHPVSLLPVSQHNDAALAAVAALRRLADLIEDAAAPEASGNLFRREGEYWTVCFEGSVARLADAKDLRLLARLLTDPGREFHAVDLEAASSQTQRPAPARARAAAGWGELQVRPDLGDAGGLLDATAKAAYKARLDELQAELDQASGADVAAAVNFAREHRVRLVVKGAVIVMSGGRTRRIRCSSGPGPTCGPCSCTTGLCRAAPPAWPGRRRPSAWAPARSGWTSTMLSPPRRAGMCREGVAPPWVSPAWCKAVVSAPSRRVLAPPRRTCWRRRSSPPTGRCAPPTRPKTQTCFGRSRAAGAGLSAWSPG